MRFDDQQIEQLTNLLHQAPMPVRRMSFSGQGLQPKQIYLYTGGQGSRTLILQRNADGFVLREMQGALLSEVANMGEIITFLETLEPVADKPQIPTLPSITDAQEKSQ
ncbi:hypothetical protein MNBD_ALPHA06-1158 [hydrothermal vent metagenome]|uniref:Uncharacterized protein n=1 Tax=hydrothermal vent metagenome TaxID=652676 RepID=A0A3B0RZF1_9ZZZZ